MSSREEFEALMRANPEGWDLHECGGIYENSQTQHDWEVWQASRQALVVELPEAFSPNDCGDWAMWQDLVEKAIEAAGVRVKA